MSTEPFIGEIKLLGFNFAPKSYALCNGATLAISTNTALYSLIGTTFGGNGTTTFNLPDLRGRSSVGQGLGPGLSNYLMGQAGGVESINITPGQMPMHNHGANGIVVKLPVGTSNADSNAANNYIADATTGMGDFFGDSPSPTLTLGAATVSGVTGMAGSNAPVPVLQPYLAINYSIATSGIYPSRN